MEPNHNTYSPDGINGKWHSIINVIKITTSSFGKPNLPDTIIMNRATVKSTSGTWEIPEFKQHSENSYLVPNSSHHI